MTNDEGGLRNQRIEVARETTTGVFPNDPDYGTYSDTITSFEWSPSPGIAERRGLGSPDVDEFYNGPEEHEITVEYDLQRFLVDSNGDPLDYAGDGVVRDGNNALPNTHAVVNREENLDVPADETVNGSNSKDTRLYVVGVGGYISEVGLNGDPSSDQPVTVSLTYQFEKVREYQVDQPDASTSLELVSTSDDDTFDVEVESDDGATTETITLSGTTTASGTESFETIDALDLQGEPTGDITVTESGTGDDLAVIRGANFYGHGEGDEGIPALGAGSHASAIGSTYETILDDTLERPTGTPQAHEINSVELTVSNDISSRERLNTPRMSMSVGNREVSLATTVVGPTESVKKAEQALGNVANNIVWTLDGGSITVENAPLTDFGGVSKTEGEAAMSLDNTFTGETVSVSSN